MDLELHIFTNSTVNSPSTIHIEETYNSFKKTFNTEIEPTIWCDPHPNIKASNRYIQNLEKKFNKVIITKSLSDGYIQAISGSKAKYVFMLEHDWTFLNIANTLQEILFVMEQDKLMHLRFNQRNNIVKNTDYYLKENNNELFDYCITPSVSNNPHILNTEIYKIKALPMIQITEGSFGIEEILNASNEIEGCIYGGINYPQTIRHTDGRHLPTKKTLMKNFLDFIRIKKR
jgi:hypothetical protein